MFSLTLMAHRIIFAHHRHRMSSHTKAHRICIASSTIACGDISKSHRIASVAHRPTSPGIVTSHRIASPSSGICITSHEELIPVVQTSIPVVQQGHAIDIASSYATSHRPRIASTCIGVASHHTASHRITSHHIESTSLTPHIDDRHSIASHHIAQVDTSKSHRHCIA